jgi:hypothetical protein
VGRLIVGVALAAFALLAGLGRAAILLLKGGEIAEFGREDVFTLVLYVSAFAGAGVVVGLLWPLLKTTLTTYLGFALGGMVMSALIMYAVVGRRTLDPIEWGFAVVMGVVFGSPFARGWLRHGGPPAA